MTSQPIGRRALFRKITGATVGALLGTSTLDTTEIIATARMAMTTAPAGPPVATHGEYDWVPTGTWIHRTTNQIIQRCP